MQRPQQFPRNIRVENVLPLECRLPLVEDAAPLLALLLRDSANRLEVVVEIAKRKNRCVVGRAALHVRRRLLQRDANRVEHSACAAKEEFFVGDER